MLPPWFQLDTLVSHHWELSRLADEQLEGVVLLVEGAEGNRVGVEVEGEPQSVPGKGVFDKPMYRQLFKISVSMKYCINENLAYRTSLLRHVEGRPQRVVLYSLTFIMYLSLDLIGNFNRV